MTLYGLTLLLVLLGLLVAALDVILFAVSPWLLPLLTGIAPPRRANAVLLARFMPVGVSFLLTAFVFLPAWWRQEPSNTGETVSATLLALALLAVLPFLDGLHRASRMFLKTRHRLLWWRRRGRIATRVQLPFEVVEVKSRDLALCVGGYLRPAIYASAHVMNALDAQELSAALAHEISHARTRDPLRLLGMGGCPDFLNLLRLDQGWRRAFASACEFAADEGASAGNREVALDLASALLKVARLSAFRPLIAENMIEVAVSSAFSSPADLEARVHALANPPIAAAVRGVPLRPWMLGAAILILGSAGVIASEPVHALIEELGRTLSR